jgi:hypothetical protein
MGHTSFGCDFLFALHGDPSPPVFHWLNANGKFAIGIGSVHVFNKTEAQQSGFHERSAWIYSCLLKRQRSHWKIVIFLKLAKMSAMTEYGLFTALSVFATKTTGGSP